MTTNMMTNPLLSNNYFGNGEFEFTDEWSRPFFQSAHRAISRCELWNWLQNFEPDEEKGFMFTTGVPQLDRLRNELAKDPVNNNHSGSSYAITLRNMEYIAKNGYNAFKNKFYK
jgi:hypothetical protein